MIGATNNAIPTVQVFNTVFLTTLVKDGPKGVEKYTINRRGGRNDIDIFTKKIIFIPVHADNHWSLFAVINPGSIANNLDEEKRGLDSYSGSL